jgi:hypothetical protein
VLGCQEHTIVVNLPMSEREWMTIGEAADRLFMSQAQLRTRAKNGDIPYFTGPNGKWRRFLRSDIEAEREKILAKRRVKPEPETIPKQTAKGPSQRLIEDYLQNRKKKYPKGYLTNPFDA